MRHHFALRAGEAKRVEVARLFRSVGEVHFDQGNREVDFQVFGQLAKVAGGRSRDGFGDRRGVPADIGFLDRAACHEPVRLCVLRQITGDRCLGEDNDLRPVPGGLLDQFGQLPGVCGHIAKRARALHCRHFDRRRKGLAGWMLTAGEHRAREKQADQDGGMPEEMTGSSMTRSRLSQYEMV